MDGLKKSLGAQELPAGAASPEDPYRSRTREGWWPMTSCTAQGDSMTTVPGSNPLRSLAIVGVLFFIIGFFTWINGPLITFVKLAFDLDEVKAFLVVFVFYISYFVLALPAAWALKRTGLKKGLALSLFVMAVGAALFGELATQRWYAGALTGLFVIGGGLALLQALLHGGIVGGRIGEHGLGVLRLLLGGRAHVHPHPIGDLAVGDGVADDLEHLFVGDAGRLEPLAVESLAEVGLVIRVQPAGQVKADLVDIPRQVHPAAHGFAGAPRIDEVVHGVKLAERGRFELPVGY